jgi:hypothetical protein
MSILPWSKKTVKGPIIAGEILAQSSALAPVDSGEMAGYPYNFMVNAEGSTMVMVDLKKDKDLHLIAFGDKSSLKSLARGGSIAGLTPIDLGSDNKKRIQAFCKEGQEQKVSELFDTLGISYVADFCQKYNLEIYKQDMYVSLPVIKTDSKDNFPLLEEINEFVKHIKKWRG